MKFGPIPVSQAEGKILAHNITRGEQHRALRKGKKISAGDISTLLAAGCQTVYIAELESGDVEENNAAFQIARSAEADKSALAVLPAVENLAIKGPGQGRASLVAQAGGVLWVDGARLDQVNNCEGIAFATLPTGSIVSAGQTVATIKIIPYAIPAKVMDLALSILENSRPLVQLRKFSIRQVGVIYSASPGARERIIKSFEQPIRHRVELYEAHVAASAYACLTGENDEATLAETFRQQVSQGAEMIIVAGETSTMDGNDVVPRAVERAGGKVVCVGAPIEPGNLVMLAYLGEKPVLGVPGCIRSPRPTPVDRILAALLSGEKLQRSDITRMGHGGLWEGVTHGS